MPTDSIEKVIQEAKANASAPEKKFRRKQKRAFNAASKLIKELEKLKVATDGKVDFEIEKPGSKDDYITIKTTIPQSIHDIPTNPLTINVYAGLVTNVHSYASDGDEQISLLRAKSSRTVKKTIDFVARQAAKQGLIK